MKETVFIYSLNQLFFRHRREYEGSNVETVPLSENDIGVRDEGAGDMEMERPGQGVRNARRQSQKRMTRSGSENDFIWQAD